MLELSVTPEGSTGLFTLTVRALDGQPVAEAGGFELVETAVSIERLAAFALNVPMFENTTLEITKTVDRPSAEIGDVVSYRVELHNATAAAVNDAVVRDVLPTSFHYAAGTARLEVPPAAPRSIEPTPEPGGVLVFNLGTDPCRGPRLHQLPRPRRRQRARGRPVQHRDRDGHARVAASAFRRRPRARPSASAAASSLRSRSSSGRVFEDANLNGQFDKGERGVAGVRIYLNNGQSVITDSEGLYNFPSVNEGAQVLSLDPVTLADGYRLAETDRRDEQSWTRLLRTPLGGGALLRQNFALRAPDREASNDTNTNATTNKSAFTSDADKRDRHAPQAAMRGSLFGGLTSDGREAAPSSSNNAGGTNGASNHATNGTNGHATNGTSGHGTNGRTATARRGRAKRRRRSRRARTSWRRTRRLSRWRRAR